MFLQVSTVHWFLKAWEKQFFLPSTEFLTMENELLRGWFPGVLTGSSCQRMWIQSYVKSPVLHIPFPGRRFSHIHVYLVGLLPQSNSFSYLFTIIDRSTRWLEAVPLQSMTVEECSKVLLRSWIPMFGVPDVIISDRGALFKSSVQVSGYSALTHDFVLSSV